MSTVRVSLRAQDFDEALKNNGIVCEYHPAVVCECVTKDSQQPLFACPLCGGNGYRYLPSSKLKVLVTSFATKTETELINLRESGTAYATPPSDIIMGFRDRLSFPDFRCKYSERIFVKRGTKISSKTYRNIQSVEAIIFGSSRFEAGVDFSIAEDRYHIEFPEVIENLIGTNVKWNEDDEVQLSILYYTKPSYLVMDILHELRAHYTTHNVPTEMYEELPKQYRLRREDFIYGVTSDEEPSSTEFTETLHTEKNLFD